MITLQAIFSDNALFQHSSPLTVSGHTDSDETVVVALCYYGDVFESKFGKPDASGRFAITIYTPRTSFEECSIKVKQGSEIVTIDHILFGELWLASGQSNMEMPNYTQREFEEYLLLLKDKKLRFFHQNRNPNISGSEYPIEPDYTMGGKWISPDQSDVRYISACATAFSKELYEYLNKVSGNVPVGFVNSGVGGTRIEAWLPQSVYQNGGEIADYLHSINAYPEKALWNTRGEGNYQQTSCMFNQLIAPHIGVKFRGILWYQGEANCWNEHKLRIYAKLLRALKESYQEIFASPEFDTFPIISSMIYPWKYNESSGECCIGYLNQAFVELNKHSPDEYIFVPICDLKPVWAFNGNHPIHPIHKYPLGERMALMCENAVYGRKTSRATQKSPAILKKCTRTENGALKLTFSNVGSGLYISGKHVRGLYISGKNGIYMPAECDILDRKSILVYARGISEPVNVAYAISSYEVETNLFAGEFPVAPFCTELDDRDKFISITLKPWLNTENDSEFICNFKEEYRDVFRQPIWRPSDRSTVCFDSDFSVTGRSLRIGGDSENFGAYIVAAAYNPLDLYNYSALNMSVMSVAPPSPKMILTYRDGEGLETAVTVFGALKNERACGWREYRYDLSDIPSGNIVKAEFAFTVESGTLRYVNIDDLWLEEK